MTAPTVYKSSDGSAPVLDGQAGSLVTVLDACLVNGYGSKTAAGWTKPFSATNKGVYLGSAGHYLDVDDSGAGAATTQEANVRGYESMTAVATGTNAFPTTAQIASPGQYVRKSAAATSTARGWILIADAQTFHLFVLTGDTANKYQSFSFGRIYSVKSSDTYRSVICAHATSGSAVTTGLDSTSLQGANGNQNGLYVARTYSGSGTSSAFGLFGLGTSLDQVGSGFTNLNPADSNIYIGRLFVQENSTLRGFLRGLYQIINSTGSALLDGDTFSGTGDFTGRTFLVVKPGAGRMYAVETSAWDSSS